MKFRGIFMRSQAQIQLRNSILFLFCTVAIVNLQGATITVTSSNGSFSPVNRHTVQAAFDAAACGDEVQIEAGAIVRTGIDGEQVVIDGSSMTVTAPYSGCTKSSR